ncbi:nonfunctional serine recombinase [Hypsugopox virus]|nr:nonfunctional serine recombinase [Hypsugopox virus]
MDTCTIVTSIISLFDTSIEFQLQICRRVANKLSMEIFTEINEHGHISELNLESDIWLKIINSSVNTLIFYKVKQISSSVEKFYNFYTQKKEQPINIIFAKDNLLFNGEPPYFSTLNFTTQIFNKKKIKDLITLLNMNTCNYKILTEFIETNFGSVDALLKLIKENMVVTMLILTNSKYRIKNRKKALIKYKKMLYKIKKLNQNSSMLISDICSKLDNMSI